MSMHTHQWMLVVTLMAVACVTLPSSVRGKGHQTQPISKTKSRNVEPAFDSHNRWVRHVPVPSRPLPRHESDGTVVERNLVIFGGKSVISSGLSDMNDTWIYNSSVQYWQSVGADVVIPKRHGHTVTRARALTGREFALLFGGEDANAAYELVSPRLYALDVEARQWSVVETPASPKPDRRKYHCAAMLDNSTFVIAGGMGSVKNVDTVWTLTLESGNDAPLKGTWQPVANYTGKAGPSGYTKACSIFNGRLHVLEATTAYLWRLDPPQDEGSTWIWTHVQVDGAPPPLVDGNLVTLTEGTSSSLHDVMVLYCSFNTRDSSTSDLFKIEPTGKYFNETLQWKQIGPGSLSKKPPPRNGHTLISFDNSVVLFGGFAGDQRFNDIWVFDPSSSYWASVNDRSEPPPSAWSNFVGMIHHTKPHFQIFGGVSTRGIFDECWEFFFEDSRWQTCDHHPRPEPRYLHAAARVDSLSFVVFGGSSYDQLFNDVWFFTHDNADAWTRLIDNVNASAAQNVAPIRRCGGTMVVWGQQLVVYGGTNFIDVFNDLWLFDMSSKAWSEIKPVTQARPHHRVTNIAAFIKGNLEPMLIVACGETGDPRPKQANEHALTTAWTSGPLTPNATNDVWAFLLQSRSWVQLREFHKVSSNGSDSTGPMAAPLPRHAMAFLALSPYKIVLSGGYSETNTILGDVWTGMFLEPDEAVLRGVPVAADHKGRKVGGWMWQQLETKNIHLRAGHDLLVGAPPNKDQKNWHNSFAIGTNSTVFLTSVGGLDGDLDLSTEMSIIEIGCSPGQFAEDFMSDACSPCPIGLYMDDFGASNCKPCPGDSSSPMNGSDAVSDCNICKPDFCTGHGYCQLDSLGQEGVCFCNTGWGGSKCNRNDLGIGFGVTIAIIVATTVTIIAVRKTRARYRRMKQEYDEQGEQLLKTKEDYAMLVSAWNIREEDIELKHKVDEGGFGEIWEGNYGEHRVAIKKLRKGLVEMDDKALDEFEYEIQFMRGIRHLNIVFFFGFGQFEDGFPFLVTEFCDRGSMYDMLHRSQDELVWHTRMSFARDTARGMTFLHGQTPRRIHRDLKSKNVLITASLTAKVADFGTSRFVDRMQLDAAAKQNIMRHNSFEASPTMTKGVGTLLWSAPELLQGRKDYDEKVDVYSFAIVLWELVTRSLPYEGIRTLYIASHVLEGNRPPLPTDFHTPGLLELIEKCWAQQPAQRPSFEQALTDIEGFFNQSETPV